MTPFYFLRGLEATGYHKPDVTALFSDWRFQVRSGAAMGCLALSSATPDRFPPLAKKKY